MERLGASSKTAIDYAVAEPAAAAGDVVLVPGSFSWDDVGDFDAVLTAKRSMVKGLTFSVTKTNDQSRLQRHCYREQQPQDLGDWP